MGKEYKSRVNPDRVLESRPNETYNHQSRLAADPIRFLEKAERNLCRRSQVYTSVWPVARHSHSLFNMDAIRFIDSLVRRQEESGAQKLLDLLKNPFSAQLAQNSVYASLGTSVGFTLLLAVGFSLLRPYNSLVYAPKLKVADDRHAPPPLGKGMFSWVAPILKTKEQDLIGLIGLDAVVFLRILLMCRNIFLAMTVIGCGILIPVNLAKGQAFKDSTTLARVTPVNTFGNANWGMTICAWIFNIIIAGFLWWNYRAVLRLRRQYYDSAEYRASLHARTLMINDIPKDFRSDEGIGRLIDQVVPTSSFSRTAIARNVKDLPDLIEQHSKTVRSLESYLAKYLKNPDNIPARRPECKPSKDDPNWGTFPRGQKVDAIEYLTDQIKEVRLHVDNRNPLSYGFASYEDIDEAHSIAYAAKKKHPQGTTLVLAPRPNDIIWKNMPLSKSQRRTRRIINNVWVTLLTLAWVAPNAMISIFVISLANLGHVWPAFQTSLERHTTWWAIVQGVASPAITSLVYLVLPIIFRRFAIRAGDRTKTARERHVAGKLYTFFTFNFLIVFSMFSTIWTFVSTVIETPTTGPMPGKQFKMQTLLRHCSSLSATFLPSGLPGCFNVTWERLLTWPSCGHWSGVSVFANSPAQLLEK